MSGAYYPPGRMDVQPTYARNVPGHSGWTCFHLPVQYLGMFARLERPPNFEVRAGEMFRLPGGPGLDSADGAPSHPPPPLP